MSGSLFSRQRQSPAHSSKISRHPTWRWLHLRQERSRRTFSGRYSIRFLRRSMLPGSKVNCRPPLALDARILLLNVVTGGTYTLSRVSDTERKGTLSSLPHETRFCVASIFVVPGFSYAVRREPLTVAYIWVPDLSFTRPDTSPLHQARGPWSNLCARKWPRIWMDAFVIAGELYSILLLTT